MSSIPLGFWPCNLASLAWLGIVVAIMGGFFVESLGYDVRYYVVCTIIFCFVVFVIDELLLGPLWSLYCFKNRRF